MTLPPQSSHVDCSSETTLTLQATDTRHGDYYVPDTVETLDAPVTM